MKNVDRAVLEKSLSIARRADAGELDMNRACDELGAIGEQNNFPEYLIEFIHLSHLQTGHENFGFNKVDLKESIEVEVRKLLENLAGRPNRVARGNDPPAPTPPAIRVRSTAVPKNQ